MTVKTQLCLCNIRGVYTNVSANYMFRPFPVRQQYTYLSLHIYAPNFVNEISSVPPDFNDKFAFLGISSDPYVQPEDGLTGKGRNM